MKLKLLILFLSFSLVSCGGSPSENSKTTIMDVVKFIEKTGFTYYYDVNKEKCVKDEDCRPFEIINSMFDTSSLRDTHRTKKISCEFKGFEPELINFSSAEESGKLLFSLANCNIKVYRYKDKNFAALNIKNTQFVSEPCYLKGYFIFCSAWYSRLKLYDNF